MTTRDREPLIRRALRATFSHMGRRETETASRARLHTQAYRLRHSDRDQRGAGVLPPGAHHARRSPGRGAAGGCVAGIGPAAAGRLRLRPSAAGAIRALAVARGPW